MKTWRYIMTVDTRKLFPPAGVRLGDWAAYADRLVEAERDADNYVTYRWHELDDTVAEFVYVDQVYVSSGERWRKERGL